MTNIPLIIISTLCSLLFFKCAYDEARSDSKGGAILMGMLGVISSVCCGMSIMGVGC